MPAVPAQTLTRPGPCQQRAAGPQQARRPRRGPGTATGCEAGVRVIRAAARPRRWRPSGARIAFTTGGRGACRPTPARPVVIIDKKYFISVQACKFVGRGARRPTPARLPRPRGGAGSGCRPPPAGGRAVAGSRCGGGASGGQRRSEPSGSGAPNPQVASGAPNFVQSRRSGQRGGGEGDAIAPRVSRPGGDRRQGTDKDGLGRTRTGRTGLESGGGPARGRGRQRTGGALLTLYNYGGRGGRRAPAESARARVGRGGGVGGV